MPVSVAHPTDRAKTNLQPGCERLRRLCRELVVDRAARRKLWDRQFVIGDWPECFLRLQSGLPEERMALREGEAVIARLESLWTRWRNMPATGEVQQVAPPPPISPVVGSGNDPQSANKRLEAEERFNKLKPCEQKAWREYQHSVERNGEFSTDREHYEWLNAHLEEGENLPAFSTWRNSVSKARQALGKAKYSRGVGHTTRSVCKISQK